MWMLQLQRVGVSRLRRRDQEGGREGGREREMAGVWGHTPLQHTRVHTHRALPPLCPLVCGERREISDPRFALHVGAIDTLIPRRFHANPPSYPSPSNLLVRPRAVALRENPLENWWRKKYREGCVRHPFIERVGFGRRRDR